MEQPFGRAVFLVAAPWNDRSDSTARKRLCLNRLQPGHAKTWNLRLSQAGLPAWYDADRFLPTPMSAKHKGLDYWDMPQRVNAKGHVCGVALLRGARRMASLLDFCTEELRMLRVLQPGPRSPRPGRPGQAVAVGHGCPIGLTG